MSLSRQCPKCHLMLVGVTRSRGKKVQPKPGDLTVCIYCAAPLVFGPDLELSHLKTETLVSLIVDDLERHIALVKSAQAVRC